MEGYLECLAAVADLGLQHIRQLLMQHYAGLLRTATAAKNTERCVQDRLPAQSHRHTVGKAWASGLRCFVPGAVKTEKLSIQEVKDSRHIWNQIYAWAGK